MPEYKPITFAPKRGAILLCNFDMARVPPEMDKRRQAIVFSIKDLNHRHALKAGLCTIIPTNSEEPATIGPEDFVIQSGKYWSFNVDSWVRAKNLFTVSHDRLSLCHKSGRPHSTEFLDDGDMEKVTAAVKYALGLT